MQSIPQLERPITSAREIRVILTPREYLSGVFYSNRYRRPFRPKGNRKRNK